MDALAEMTTRDVKTLLKSKVKQRRYQQNARSTGAWYIITETIDDIQLNLDINTLRCELNKRDKKIVPQPILS